MKSLAISALLLAATMPTFGNATLLGGDPGPIFPMPGTGDAYMWLEPMLGTAPGDALLDFTVVVPIGGANLKTFQVFGGCDVYTGYLARFSLSVNAVATPWSWTWEDLERVAFNRFHIQQP